MNMLKSELLKLKKCWLLRLSFLITFLLPLLTVSMIAFSVQARQAAQPEFLLLLRQNHIFLTLLICNLLFSLIATHLFFKEFQYGTIADIISVPVKRVSYIVVKEIVLFFWMMAIGLFSYLICLVIGAVSSMTGFASSLVLHGLWKYGAATAIGFIPMQLIIWVTLLFKNYVVSLAVSTITLVGSIVAFNTKDFIFIYPNSIAFVLTNFQTPVTTDQILTSVISLTVVMLICLSGIMVCFTRMDIKTGD